MLTDPKPCTPDCPACAQTQTTARIVFACIVGAAAVAAFAYLLAIAQ